MKKHGRLALVFIVASVVGLLLPCLSLAGSLEPSGSPGPTMRTLDEIYSTNSWSKKLPCDSQINCPRFEVLADFNNEAVLDKETGLVWWKNASRYSSIWGAAISICNDSELGGRKGWRLPTVAELTSLVDPTQQSLPLPSGHPFVNVYSGSFWSATNDVGDTSRVDCVSMGCCHGDVGVCYKTGPFDFGVWCVRGGQGVGSQ
jgi:hypothetical protein